MTTVLWVLLGVPSAVLVTIVAGRFLGARRAWLALVVSGVVGWTAGVLVAGELTGFTWDEWPMALLSLPLGILFTMSTALVIDLVAPVGSLAKGDAAGLLALRNPVAEARRSIEPLRRYREVVRLARRNGIVGRGEPPGGLPAAVRQTLEQAGGLFVKLGQVASTRSDVLPREWCVELSRLRSAAEPAPPEHMRPHLTGLLGDDPDRVFADFDWTPLAAASIGQVYRARLHDGTEAVVKVQRPGLERTLELDSAVVMQVAQLVERRTVIGVTVRPATLAEEFVDGVMEELDFRIEAANAVDLGAAIATVDRVRVPRTFPELSGERFLTQEFVDAVRIGQRERLITAGHDPAELAERLLQAFLQQIFVAGTFHADPHPGNILVEDDGTIVLIDLGAVGRIGPSHRSAVLGMLTAAGTGDSGALRESLETLTVIDRTVDRRELEAALEGFLARNMRAGAGITAQALDDLVVLVGRHGITLPRWFGTLLRTLVTLEGTLTTLQPGFSLVDAARRQAGRVSGVGSVTGMRELVEREVATQLPRLRRLPEQVDELLGQVIDGRLVGRVSMLSDEHDERVVTRLVDRLVLGLIASAVGIGSVMLLGVESGPTFGDSVRLDEVLGYFGLGAATLLALRVIAGIIRDGVV